MSDVHVQDNVEGNVDTTGDVEVKFESMSLKPLFKRKRPDLESGERQSDCTDLACDLLACIENLQTIVNDIKDAKSGDFYNGTDHMITAIESLDIEKTNDKINKLTDDLKGVCRWMWNGSHEKTA
jgi:hypothetical protein